MPVRSLGRAMYALISEAGPGKVTALAIIAASFSDTPGPTGAGTAVGGAATVGAAAPPLEEVAAGFVSEPPPLQPSEKSTDAVNGTLPVMSKTRFTRSL